MPWSEPAERQAAGGVELDPETVEVVIELMARALVAVAVPDTKESADER
ncbi:MAG: hypothetical protein HYY76_00885 [Acidobacteria bacterium]|nr:hypothetical protein [Acidobacteriota bacterium]